MATDDSITDDADLARALEILERDQPALLPTDGQRRLYRLYNVVGWAQLPAWVGAGAAEGAFGDSAEYAVAFFGLILVAFPLMLLLNLPLIRRLDRHATLRRRTGLYLHLRTAFAAARRRQRIRNALTMFGVVVGAVLLLLALVLVRDFYAEEADPSVAFRLFSSMFYAVLGTSWVAWHFLRRGMERLEVVADLQRSFAAGAFSLKGQEKRT